MLLFLLFGMVTGRRTPGFTQSLRYPNCWRLCRVQSHPGDQDPEREEMVEKEPVSLE